MKDVFVGLQGRDIREHNLALLLGHLDDVGAASRTDLSAATRLVPGAISLLTSELRDAGLVRPVEDGAAGAPGPAARRGRRPEMLELDGRSLGVVAVQVALGEVVVHAADLGGRVVLRERRDVHVPVGDPAGVVRVVAAAAHEGFAALAAVGARPVGLELVVPAPVSAGSGRIPVAVDLGWRDVDLGGLVAPHLPDLPLGVTVRNDATSATHAELVALRRAMPGVVVTDLVYLKADTGIGGGAVVDGHHLRGSTGRTFEPGHLVVVPDGRMCACGRRGCLVTVAGPDVVLASAGLADLRDMEGAPAALRELVRMLGRGNPQARWAVDEANPWIRQALTNICVLLSPQVVVLGGYLAHVVDDLAVLDEQLLDRLGLDGLAGADAIVPARLGAFSAVDGAVLLARRELLARPGLLRGLGGASPLSR